MWRKFLTLFDVTTLLSFTIEAALRRQWLSTKNRIVSRTVCPSAAIDASNVKEPFSNDFAESQRKEHTAW